MVNRSSRRKHLLRSRTFWLNAIAAAVTVVLYFLGVPIPSEVVTTVVGSSLGNIGLRLVTKDGVTLQLHGAE